MLEERKITFDRVVRWILIALGIFVSYLFIKRISGALLPFAIAWLIAYLIYPLIKLIHKALRIKSRIVVVIIALLLVLGFLTGLAFMVIPPIIKEFGMLTQLLENFINSGNYIEGWAEKVVEFITEKINTENITESISKEGLFNLLKESMPPVWNLFSRTLQIVVGILAALIVLLYIIFILLDYEVLANGWIKFVPSTHQSKVIEVIKDVETGMNRYFRGQSLIAFIVGILFSVGFSIINLPLAIGFGLFVGLLNLVPYLQIVSIIPAFFLILIKTANTNQSFWMITLSVVIVYIVVQAIQDLFLTPKIMGKVTGFHPAIILLSLSIWGSLLGLVGMIIALPLTNLLLTYYQRFLKNRDKLGP